MHKRLSLFLCAGALAALVSGCSMIEYVPADELSHERLTTPPNATTLGHVFTNNWGVYFFGYPIFSGDFNHPDSVWDVLWFEDTSSVEATVAATTLEAKRRGGDAVVDLKSEYCSTWLILWWVREVSSSGNVVKFNDKGGAR